MIFGLFLTYAAGLDTYSDSHLPHLMPDRLQKKLEHIASESHAESFAVVYRDCASEKAFSINGETLFHAASAIKLPILFALFRAVEEERFVLEDRLHVRNRFFSVVDRSPYQMDASRDGDSEVYGRVGRTMPIQELAKSMIVASSNLATNLLLDFIGLKFAQAQLASFSGIHLRRGVEDHVAFDKGINNELSAEGLTALLLGIQQAKAVTHNSRQAILDILFEQKFNEMIPKGLPASARVAHKTGEISSVCHDAGIIFPQKKEPYLLTILTKSSAAPAARRQAVAKMAHAIHHHFRE